MVLYIITQCKYLGRPPAIGYWLLLLLLDKIRLWMHVIWLAECAQIAVRPKVNRHFTQLPALPLAARLKQQHCLANTASVGMPLHPGVLLLHHIGSRALWLSHPNPKLSARQEITP